MSSDARHPPARLKVLYVIVGLDVGGTERQLTELVLRLNRRWFDPVVCCLTHRGPLAEVIESTGVHVEVIGLRKFEGGGLREVVDYVSDTLGRLCRFVRFVFAQRPHVLQGLLFWASIVGIFTARAARVPVILSTRRSMGHIKEGKPGLRLIERLANRLTGMVIANAEAVKADVIRQEGLRPEKVVVIRNGIDTDRFGLSCDPDLRREIGVQTDGPIVGVIANFLRYKGHEFFFEAWKSVVRAHPDATALLVGDGSLRSPLEARVKADGLASSMNFLGTRSDVPRVLALMDIVAHPSLEEGSSNAILESMAAAKPVVATAVGGNVEAIVHQQTGLLVPPRDAPALANAICWLIRNPETASAFGIAGRRRVLDCYSVDAMVRAYEALYVDQWQRVDRPGRVTPVTE